jgi:hypothetical protein
MHPKLVFCRVTWEIRGFLRFRLQYHRMVSSLNTLDSLHSAGAAQQPALMLKPSCNGKGSNTGKE